MKICQIYLPAVYRSYGERALGVLTSHLLPSIKYAGFDGVYLIGLWKDGGYDNGFDIVEYVVNPKFTTNLDFKIFEITAHQLGLKIGVDVVPNHTSDQSRLAQNCLNDAPEYEEVLYVVSKEEAKRLTRSGVPNFFGKLAYSDFEDKYVRSTFADYHQLNLNWHSLKVKEYFKEIFSQLRRAKIDFARIDCGMMLLEDVSKADPANPMAVFNPKASIDAIREVAGDMPLFFEWFDLGSLDLFNNLDNCWALDCSYVLTGQVNTNWNHEKVVPLLGGHDQMTLADRGLDTVAVTAEALKSKHVFSDLQTELGWTTEAAILPSDEDYDADIKNPNQRYRARRPMRPIIEAFIKKLG